MSRPKVLLADDHKAMAQSLVRFLDHEVEIVGVVSDGQALIDSARQAQPDVIVTDLSMPVKSGWDAFNELRTSGFAAPFIFLTANDDVELAAELVAAGGAGFVLKQAAASELVAAIRKALQGEVFVSALISRRQSVGRIRRDRGRSASS